MIAEWVPESDWSRVKVGQKVRLVNADGEVTLKVTRLPDHFEWVESKASAYWRDVWSLFVEAPPAVVLPGEPGIYADRYGEPWELDETGEWWQEGLGNTDVAAAFAPFTLLSPVPETAKKVIERIKAESVVTRTPMRHDLSIGLSALLAVAAEFGVTE